MPCTKHITKRKVLIKAFNEQFMIKVYGQEFFSKSVHHDFSNTNTNAEKMVTFFNQLLVAIGPGTSAGLDG